MAKRNPYDGFIEEIGDRLYHRPKLKGRVSKERTTAIRYGVKVSAKKPSQPPRLSTRGTIKRVARKAPEVMVKISGAGKSKQQIKEHMDYISRNGTVELETEDGRVLEGKGLTRSLVDSWGDDDCQLGMGGQMPARRSQGYRREAFNIVLSMPPGTEREKVKDAARAFAEKTFSGHRYVFAAHNDEAHPHVHLCVKAVDHDGIRLNPRKADLQRWREAFAHELRVRGVDAVATKRIVRGRTRRPDRQAIRHLERRTGTSRSKRGRVQAVIDESRRKDRKNHPGDVALKKGREEVVEQYKALAGYLKAGDSQDARLAGDVRKILANMEPPKSRHVIALEHMDSSKPGAFPEKSNTKKGADRL